MNYFVQLIAIYFLKSKTNNDSNNHLKVLEINKVKIQHFELAKVLPDVGPEQQQQLVARGGLTQMSWHFVLCKQNLKSFDKQMKQIKQMACLFAPVCIICMCSHVFVQLNQHFNICWREGGRERERQRFMCFPYQLW